MSENSVFDPFSTDAEILAAVTLHGPILGGCNGRCQFLRSRCDSDDEYRQRVQFHNWMVPRLGGELGLAGALELIDYLELTSDREQDGPPFHWFDLQDGVIPAHNWSDPAQVDRFWHAVANNSWSLARGERFAREAMNASVDTGAISHELGRLGAELSALREELASEVRTRHLIVEGPEGAVMIGSDGAGPWLTLGSGDDAHLVIRQTNDGKGITLVMLDGDVVDTAERYLELSVSQPVPEHDGQAVISIHGSDHTQTLFELSGVDGAGESCGDLALRGRVRDIT